MVAPFGQAVKDRPLGQTVDVKARISMCLIALFRFKLHIRTRREKKSGIVHNSFGISVDRIGWRDLHDCQYWADQGLWASVAAHL
jgi:hypothetical protein